MRLIHSLLALIAVLSMSEVSYGSESPSQNEEAKVTISVYYYKEGESNYFDVGTYQFDKGDPYVIQSPKKSLYKPDPFSIEGFATADESYIVTYHSWFLDYTVSVIFIIVFIVTFLFLLSVLFKW